MMPLLQILGWIPENYLDKIDSLDGIQLNDMCALIKLLEHPDKITDQNHMNTFINLNNFPKITNQIKNLINYFQKDQEELKMKIQDCLNLYDLNVPSIYFTFQKPYLTPDKYKESQWFWGSCSYLGILSIIQLIRK